LSGVRKNDCVKINRMLGSAWAKDHSVQKSGCQSEQQHLKTQALNETSDADHRSRGSFVWGLGEGFVLVGLTSCLNSGIKNHRVTPLSEAALHNRKWSLGSHLTRLRGEGSMG